MVYQNIFNFFYRIYILTFFIKGYSSIINLFLDFESSYFVIVFIQLNSSVIE